MCNCNPKPKDTGSKLKMIKRQIRKIWEETTQEKNFTVKPLNGKKKTQILFQKDYKFIIIVINKSIKHMYYNTDPEDNFNPEDHGIEMDEIAKIYAMADMKEEQKKWAIKKALELYEDFKHLNADESIKAVYSLIKTGALTLNQVNEMFDNMISIFEETEEYEKCHKCLLIKKGVNNRFESQKIHNIFCHRIYDIYCIG